MNRKGQFEGIAGTIVGAFGFVLAVLFVFLVVSGFNDGIQNTNSSTIPNKTLEISADYTEGFSAFDTGFGLLMVGFLIVCVVFTRTMPEKSGWFLVVGILGAMIFGLIGFIMENIWYGLNTNAEITAVTNTWTFIPFILDNFVLVLIVYTMIITIAAMTNDGGIQFD